MAHTAAAAVALVVLQEEQHRHDDQVSLAAAVHAAYLKSHGALAEADAVEKKPYRELTCHMALLCHEVDNSSSEVRLV